jgi:hypothetical protein
MKYVVSPTSISAHFIGTTPTSTYSDQFTLTAGSSGGGPTASRLTWITAHRAGKTTVVRWRSPAMSVLGFNLFGAGHARPLNRTLIPARGLHHTYVVRVPGAYRLIQQGRRPYRSALALPGNGEANQPLEGSWKFDHRHAYPIAGAHHRDQTV